MRVIAGKYKGRRIAFTKGSDILRPTQDRVKEALFSIVSEKVSGAVCLDLCCGTGSLGIEALSRGASGVTFVDTDTRVLKKNLEALGIDATVVRRDCIRFLAEYDDGADIIFLDPPWRYPQVYGDALNAICEFGILNPSGLIVCEHRKDQIMDIPDRLRIKASRTYSDTSLSILEKNDEKSNLPR